MFVYWRSERASAARGDHGYVIGDEVIAERGPLIAPVADWRLWHYENPPKEGNEWYRRQKWGSKINRALAYSSMP